MEQREVLIILVIVGAFLFLNQQYTGYQVMPIHAQGSGSRTFTSTILTGDSGQQREIVGNRQTTGPYVSENPYDYDPTWEKRCSSEKDCPRRFNCDLYSHYCTPNDYYPV